MAAGGQATPSGGVAGPPPPQGGQGGQGGVFGPTERPMEDPNQGSDTIAPQLEDAQQTLRILYSQFPHPSIGRLLDPRPDAR